MADFPLKTGNDRVRLKKGFVDTVVVESGSRRDVDIVRRFESQDKIDLRAFGIDDAQEAQKLIEDSMPRRRGRGVILKGAFGRLVLVLCGITQEQLHPSNFILGNRNPAAINDTAVTTENIPVRIDVLANDIDPDGDPLFIQGISESASGASVVLIDGETVVYIPSDGFTGIDRFRYTISDGNGGTDSATVTVRVEPENIAPVALPDLASTEQSTSVNIDVLDNDFDPDSEAISISDFTTDTENGGSVEIESDNDTLLYSPSLFFAGTDSFSYTISDGLLTDTATVTVTVDPANSAPIPVEDVVLEEPNSPVVIDDFIPGEDVLRGGLTFSDIEITAGTGSSIGNTMIAIESSNELIAEQIGVQPAVINSNDLTFI